MCNQVYILCMHYMCITHVSTIHVIHLYLYTYNTLKTPYMYYMCNTIGHVVTCTAYGAHNGCVGQ